MQDILKKVYRRHKISRYIELIIGTLIISLSFNLFILPNNLVIGGVGGLSIIARLLFNIEPAIFIFIASLILLVISFIFLGKEKTKASIIGSLLFPLFVKLTSNIGTIISFEGSETILLVLFGGVFYGLGAGLVFKAGFTTGGTDILNQIVSKYLKVSIGNAMIIVDGIIVVWGAFFFGGLKFMYSIIVLYMISTLTDKVLLGISNSKAFYIITSKKEEVCDFVINELKHSITTINAKGAASGKSKNVLFAVVPTKEYFKFKTGIKEIDSDAFITVVDAYEVMGGE